MMKPFSLLVKPVGGACNLACKYCFYSDHAGGVMPEAVCERMLDTYAALPFKEKAVALQGGEPLLSPDYIFDRMDAASVDRSLQTNGTLLTPERADRLRRGNWLVGLSLDGPPALNARRYARRHEFTPVGTSQEMLAQDAFDQAVRGIRLLEDFGVDYNLLTVVSRGNVGRAREIYRYFRENFTTRYYQFIECTGPCEEITGEEWGRFLCELFDEWVQADAYTISIRTFDSIVSQLVRGIPTQCSFADGCNLYLVVEHDGSVYPCDFHVREDLKLGNVMTHSWEQMLSSPVYRRFAERKCAGLSQTCRVCRYFGYCHGDCPRNRCAGRSTLCAGWKRFFAHTLGRFEDLVANLPR